GWQGPVDGARAPRPGHGARSQGGDRGGAREGRLANRPSQRHARHARSGLVSRPRRGSAVRLDEVLSRVLESARGDLFTTLRGIVQVYDPILRTVDVLPAVRRPMSSESGEIVHEELPVLPGVRVGFPCGSGVLI